VVAPPSQWHRPYGSRYGNLERIPPLNDGAVGHDTLMAWPRNTVYPLHRRMRRGPDKNSVDSCFELRDLLFEQPILKDHVLKKRRS
jgi:hypothetical protein